jgi:hypothetical protein
MSPADEVELLIEVVVDSAVDRGEFLDCFHRCCQTKRAGAGFALAAFPIFGQQPSLS